MQEHTGSEPSTIDGATLDRVLRNEELKQCGLDHLLESRVIGAKSPLELSDAEVADRLWEHGSKVVVSAHLEKMPEDITGKDFARFDEMVLDAYADGIYGKPADELSDIERMRLASAIRNDQFDAAVRAGNAGNAGNAGDGSNAVDGAGDGADGTDAAAGGGRQGLGGIDGDLRFGSGAIDDDAVGNSAGAATGDSTGTGAGSGTANGSETSQVGGTASGSFGDVALQPTGPAGDQPATEGTSPVPSDTSTPSAPTTPPSTPPPPEDTAPVDYGQGQSMPAYDDDGFVGSVAGPEDLASGNGTWFLVWGQDTSPHYVNDTTGHVAVMVDGQWVDASTGQPVDAINNQQGSGGGTDSTTTSGGSSDSGESNSAESAQSSSDESDDGSDDDDDDDDDDDSSEDTSAEATGEDDASSDEESSSAGGDAGTPNPELTFVDPVARAAFQSTPVGRADRRNDERGIEQNAPGAGLTDPPDEGGEQGGSSGGPVRFVGGAIDPSPDADRSTSVFSEIDEMRLPNAGLVDPEDEPVVGGDNPIIGGSGPIVGGVFDATLDADNVFEDRPLGVAFERDELASGFDAEGLDDYLDG